MKFIVAIAIGLLINSNLLAQMVDVAAIHHFSRGKLSLLLFENEGDYLSVADDPFTARTYEMDDPDIAVLNNYFGTAPGTKQSIFIFESDGTSFSLLPGDVYNWSRSIMALQVISLAIRLLI